MLGTHGLRSNTLTLAQIQNLPWPDFSVALQLLCCLPSGLPVKTCLLILSTLAFHSIWLWCRCFLVICYLAMVFALPKRVKLRLLR